VDEVEDEVEVLSTRRLEVSDALARPLDLSLLSFSRCFFTTSSLLSLLGLLRIHCSQNLKLFSGFDQARGKEEVEVHRSTEKSEERMTSSTAV